MSPVLCGFDLTGSKFGPVPTLLLILLSVYWTWVLAIARQPVQRPVFKVLGVVLLVVASSMFLGLNDLARPVGGYGGTFGAYVASGVSNSFLGGGPAAFLLVVAVIASFLLATDWLFLPMFVRLRDARAIEAEPVVGSVGRYQVRGGFLHDQVRQQGEAAIIGGDTEVAVADLPTSLSRREPVVRAIGRADDEVLAVDEVRGTIAPPAQADPAIASDAAAEEDDDEPWYARRRRLAAEAAVLAAGSVDTDAAEEEVADAWGDEEEDVRAPSADHAAWADTEAEIDEEEEVDQPAVGRADPHPVAVAAYDAEVDEEGARATPSASAGPMVEEEESVDEIEEDGLVAGDAARAIASDLAQAGPEDDDEDDVEDDDEDDFDDDDDDDAGDYDDDDEDDDSDTDDDIDVAYDDGADVAHPEAVISEAAATVAAPTATIDPVPQATAALASSSEGASFDALYLAAGDLVVAEGRASISFLQRSLGVGYFQAAKLLDRLQRQNVIGSYTGAVNREVLMSAREWGETRGS